MIANDKIRVFPRKNLHADSYTKVDFSKRAFNQGKRLLKELMPKALEMIGTPGGCKLMPVSDRAKRHYVTQTLASMRSAIVYQVGKGWFGDVIFGLGDGNNLGKPFDEPRATRQEAERDVLLIIAGVFEKEQQRGICTGDTIH